MVTRALPRIGPAAAAADPAPTLALPTRSLLPLCLFAFGMLIAEGTVLDWGAVFLRDVVEVSAGATGLGFAAFALLMTVGRLLGDRLAERFGPVALARACGLIGLAGMVALVTAHTLWQAAIALAAAGFGVSVAVPLSPRPGTATARSAD